MSLFQKKKKLSFFLSHRQRECFFYYYYYIETSFAASPIVIENGNFTWGEKDADPVLKNINLNVPRGSLVAIVGAVGSGKSSLLAAMLGEMNKISGRVNTHGKCHFKNRSLYKN